MKRTIWALAIWLGLCGSAQGASRSCALLLEHAAPAPYTEMLRAGLERAGREFGLDVKVIVAGPDSDRADAFARAAAENGLVIVATDEFYEILRNNAANFRRCAFGVIDAGIRAANTSCITFADEQAAFLAGAAAALVAKEKGNPVIGWLSGLDTPAMRSLFSGYAAGAEIAAPEVRVIQGIAGSFTDEAAAADKARMLGGASVVALAAGAGNAAAARALDARDVLFIGLDAAQNALPARKTVGIITKAVERAVYEICRDFAQDKFRAREITVFDLAGGGTGFALSREFGGKKWPGVSRRAHELERELMAGNISLASKRDRTLCDCLD